MLIKKHILLQIIATTLLGITSASASEGEVDTLLQRIQLISSENPQESRQLASAMYKLAKQTKNPDNVAKAYMAYTEIYIANNLWKQANAYIDSAMAIAKRYKNYKQQAELQILLGKLNYRADNPRLGSEAINDAIKLASISRDNDLLVRIKLIQADFIKQKGNFTESITIKNQALNIAAMDKLKSSEADCHLSIGSSYWQMGQFNEALECYYKALLIEGQINDTLGLIHTFKNLGLTYRELGQYEKCLSVLNRGLNLSKKTNNKYETGEILNILGSLHFRFSQFDEAIRYYNQSLSIREELGLTRSQILTHENIARVLSQKSQFDEALDHLNTALQLQSQITDPLAEASTLTEMGNLNLQKGNIAEALRRYLMALKLRQSFGQDEDVAKSLTNIGLAYRKLGMYKSSLKYMEQAHDIINAKELNTNDAAYILQNLGHIYQDVKQFNKAIGTYKEALALKEKGGDESGTSKILQNIAQVQLQMQHISKARSSLSQALKISNRLKDAREVADIYNEMGNVERQANNPDMAIKYYKNAASQYQALLNPEGKALCLRKIGEIQTERKQFADAEQNINQSIKTGYQAGNAHLL
ncbi:MAG: tetratricopeptide repeat protein, partial [Bacteroidales bacterium]